MMHKNKMSFAKDLDILKAILNSSTSSIQDFRSSKCTYLNFVQGMHIVEVLPCHSCIIIRHNYAFITEDTCASIALVAGVGMLLKTWDIDTH